MPPRSATAEDAAVGSRILDARQKLGLTRATLAAQVGVSQQQIQKYEIGADRVSAVMLNKIADVLLMPLAWFHGSK